MASDGYRGSQSTYDDYLDARNYNTDYRRSSYQSHTPLSPRSRASSRTRSDTSQQPAFYEAVNNTFDKTDAASQVDPAIIQQITEQVKKQVLDSLKTGGIPVQSPPPQARTNRSSTSSTATYPIRNVYTPPSPTREHPGTRYNSPERASQESLAAGAEDVTGTRACNNIKPPPTQGTAYDNTPTRPAAPERTVTESETTTVEKIWQPLFEKTDGTPTARLGQFLRGLALHIIDDYEPKKSLVIPPAKMLKFYEDVKLPEEIYPWRVIFSQLSHSALSKIYRDLKCEHHFIQQDSHSEEPRIPALTPVGFQAWMTAFIQAYPDAEAQRLANAVLHMPISNADNPRERFPKDLPRRLFPKHENPQAQQRCAAALTQDPRITLAKRTAFPPPTQPLATAQSSPEADRKRNPYSSVAGDSSVSSAVVYSDDDEPDSPPSVPLERERKPYSAQPGGGKVYNDSASEPALHHSSHLRTHSSALNSDGTPRDYNPTASNRHYRNSAYIPSGYNGGEGRHRRPRSPSFGPYGTRSDSNVTEIPGSYYQSNLYDAAGGGRDPFDEEWGEHRTGSDWARRRAEEGYPASPPPSASGARTSWDDYDVSATGYRGRRRGSSVGGISSYAYPQGMPGGWDTGGGGNRYV